MLSRSFPDIPPDIKTPLLPPDRDAILRSELRQINPSATDEQIEIDVNVRHYWFRYRYLPWIMSVVKLTDARVLEVGGGTGASTVALAERGAIVTCLDQTEISLTVTKKRGELHDVGAQITTICGNASNIDSLLKGQLFDMIAYCASLEHMTHDERMATLRAAWAMLKPGAFLLVCDLPNRLWFYDHHTSFENFFLWLPDQLAIEYSAKTKRLPFNSDFLIPRADDVNRLARWGRGVSFHEFEIALNTDVKFLDVSGEWDYRRQADVNWSRWWNETTDGQYHRLLRLIAPELQIAFTDPEIAVPIRKPFDQNSCRPSATNLPDSDAFGLA